MSQEILAVYLLGFLLWSLETRLVTAAQQHTAALAATYFSDDVRKRPTVRLGSAGASSFIKPICSANISTVEILSTTLVATSVFTKVLLGSSAPTVVRPQDQSILVPSLCVDEMHKTYFDHRRPINIFCFVRKKLDFNLS